MERQITEKVNEDNDGDIDDLFAESDKQIFELFNKILAEAINE